MQLYIHEWSELIPIPIGDDALYEFDDLPLYRDREARAVYLFVAPEAGTPLGFALTMRDATGAWHVEEFFVIAGARRRGIGKKAAEALFATHPGRWTLTVRPENPRALAFWRGVKGVVKEEVEDGEDGVARTRISYDV